MNLRVMHWLTVILPLAFFAVTEYIRHFIYPEFLHSWVGYTLTLGAIAAGVLVFSQAVFITLERMERDILRQNRELSALNTVSRVVGESPDQRELLKRALDKVLEVTSVETGVVFLADEELTGLTLATHRGIPPESVDMMAHLKVGEGFAGRVAQTGEPLSVEDYGEYPESTRIFAQRAGVHSLASIPLKAKDKVLGVMSIGSRGRRRFSPEELALLSVLGSQIGVAIENARLHDKVQQTSSYLQTIIESSGQAIIVIDLQGKIVLWSRGAETIYGWSKEEAIGSVMPMVPEDGRAEAGRNLARILQTGETLHNSEVERLRNDGALIPVMVTASPIRGADGRIVGMVGISTDMRDKKRLETELLRERQALAVMEERERIGMDLHDGVIQSLYAVGLNLENCADMIQEAPGDVEYRLGEAVKSLNGVIRNMRNYIFGLRPRSQDSHGFDHALGELVKEFRINTLIEAELTVQGEAHTRLARDQSDHLFHIAQESLANVAKHAGATAATVALSTDNGRLILSICDNGKGFDSKQARTQHGQGLRNMSERAKALRGTLRVNGDTAQGTQVVVEMPAPVGQPQERA
ncbi:MAG: GAF domain-containing protein [Chloroflexi bacterium]|nr:GAF domain-containing protein [Chloroflexota bacterium]